MSRIDEKQIKKLLDDIATIKAVIKENQPIMRQLLLPIHFRVISYISGIGLICVSMTYYFFLNQYGSYSSIPDSIRTVLLVIIGALFLMVGILKGLLWVKSVHTVNRELSFGQMIQHLYSDQILHTWIPAYVLMAFLGVYFCYNGTAQYIIPIVAFGVGFICNMIGGMTRIWQYLLIGYWVIITGALSLVFTSISPLIWLSLSLGLGLVFFGSVSKTSAADKKKD
jgi:hypothetical protein